ncbi:MAG: thioesterase family protein [Anaerolineales bacterium]
MSRFGFYQSIEVRYGDLDPQGHVNNARYLTYLEQARIGYFRHLDLWKGDSFLDIGIILADVHLTFRTPILLGHQVRVGVRVARLGNKSLTMEYSLEEASNHTELATASSVLVSYDYHTGQTVPISPEWRRTITHFEGLEADLHEGQGGH